MNLIGKMIVTACFTFCAAMGFASQQDTSVQAHSWHVNQVVSSVAKPVVKAVKVAQAYHAPDVTTLMVVRVNKVNKKHENKCFRYGMYASQGEKVTICE